MEYIEKQKKAKGLLFKKVFQPKLSTLTNLKKGRARQRINKEVFDPEDAIADNAKLLSLLMSIFIKLYDAQFNLDNLDPADKLIIDSWIEIAKNTDTRFTDQFQSEGYSLLTKLLSRQSSIAKIIEEEYNNKEAN